MSDPFDPSSPDPIDVEVGLRIRNLRKERGISQGALAEALGVTFQQVQKYERGVNRISASMLMRAARALGVSPGVLLPREDDAAAISAGFMATLARTRGADELAESFARIASPRLRRAVLTFARSVVQHEVSEGERGVQRLRSGI